MPVAERLDVFTPFLKKERDADGVLWVEGKFTGPDLDSDGQRMDPTWLKGAIPAYMKVGNVREGHDPHRAIGKAVQVWETDDQSWHMRAKIVDPVAENKIEHGILSGFSIGVANYGLAKAVDAPNGKICRGDVIEVSCVDRPSLPSAMFRMATLSKTTGALALVDEPEVVEGDDLDKTTEPAESAPGPSMLLKTDDGQVRPMTTALVDELTAPTVVANPDDPDAADPEALEKAKKAGKKAPPFTSDDKPKANDGSEDDADESDDEDDGKKPATKAAEVDYAAGRALLYKAFAERYRWTPAQVDTLSAEHLAALTDPELNAQMVAAVRHAPDVVKTAEPDIVKSVDDEMADIARAKRILADLAVLVQSEAAGFIDGVPGEVWDMEMLVSVMTTLSCFVEREEMEAAAMAETTASGDTTPAAPTVMQLAATPDATKTAEAAEPVAPAEAAKPSLGDELARRLDKAVKKARKAAAAKAATPESTAPVAVSTTDTETLTKAVADKVTADLAVQLGDVFTKAMGPVIDRVAEVETLLKSTPRPGGPAVTRVQPAVSPAETVALAEKAMKVGVIKSALAATSDPVMRGAYEAQLAELEKPAA